MRRVLRRRLHQGGLTILEQLVVAAILGVIVIVLLASLGIGRNAYTLTEAQVIVQEEARRALGSMLKELRNAGRMRQAGDVVGNADFANQSAIDFQLARSFDQAGCGGICWGDGTGTGRWLHYRLVPMSPLNVQLQRCSTANQTDPIDPAACRVIANTIQSMAIAYAQATQTVHVQLQTRQTDPRMPGGSVAVSPTPLIGQVDLRNPS